jgi:hypothetical protein
VLCLTIGKVHVCRWAILERLADAPGNFPAPITASAGIADDLAAARLNPSGIP